MEKSIIPVFCRGLSMAGVKLHHGITERLRPVFISIHSILSKIGGLTESGLFLNPSLRKDIILKCSECS